MSVTVEIARRLSGAHRKQLIEGSGLSPEVIEARGYFTVKGPELIWLGFRKYQLAPGLVIPQYNPMGERVGHQLRRDTPRHTTAMKGLPRSLRGYARLTSQGREIKYENAAGSHLHLDINPLMVDAIQDPSVPLWITEGSKKVDAAASHDMCAISLTGVWGWQSQGEPLADWDLIPLDDREVLLAFDSDVMTKPEVQSALDRLTEFLESL